MPLGIDGKDANDVEVEVSDNREAKDADIKVPDIQAGRSIVHSWVDCWEFVCCWSVVVFCELGLL